MKAEVKIVIKLNNPEDAWTNTETAEAESEKGIAAYCVQRIAKILGEGGILEMNGPLSWSFIPLARIVKIDVFADEQHIQLPTAEDLAGVLRAPNAPVQFRKPKPSKDVM